MNLSDLNKRWIGFIAIILGSLSLAGCFHDRPHKGGDMMFDYLSWKLDLNEEQQGLLEEIRTEMDTIREQTREQRAEDKATAIALIKADTLDTTAAMALLNKKQDTINTHAPSVLEKVAALHATLSAEQKNIIIEKLNKMRHHHKHH